jgi:hypothetical protein
MEMSGQLHTPAALPPGKKQRAPGNKWIGGWVGPITGGEDKNSHPLPRLEPPIIQPINQRYTTVVSQLPITCISKIIFHF